MLIPLEQTVVNGSKEGGTCPTISKTTPEQCKANPQRNTRAEHKYNDVNHYIPHEGRKPKYEMAPPFKRSTDHEEIEYFSCEPRKFLGR